MANFKAWIIDQERTRTFIRNDEIIYVEDPALRFTTRGVPFRSRQAIIIFCTAGCISGTMDLTEYKVEENGFLVILPRRILGSITMSEDFKGVFVLFGIPFTESLNFGENFSPNFFLSNSPYHKLEGDGLDVVNTYFNALKKLLLKEDFTYTKEIARLITRAFILGLASLSPKLPVPTDNSRQAKITSKFVKLVSSNYRTHREMDFYSGKLGLTAKYITTIVKECTGKSATDWIERFVVLDAQTMLASTDLSIQQIADELNFPSQSFFGKYFKRITGLSPKEYRTAAINNTL